MSSKPSRNLDWINDDSASKYTVPDGPTQLAGHINDTNADPKLFNWCWWRISQWIEYLDELELNQIPDSTDYGKVKTDDLTSNRVDFEKLNGISVTKAEINELNTAGCILADFQKLAGITSSDSEINQLDGVTVGGSSTGDIATIDDTQILTNKRLNSPKINEDVVLSVIATDLNQLSGVTVGGTSSGDITTIDDTQELTNKTINGGTVKNADFKTSETGERVEILDSDNNIHYYGDRGDTTIVELLKVHDAGNFVIDLGSTNLDMGAIDAKNNNSTFPAGNFYNANASGYAIKAAGGYGGITANSAGARVGNFYGDDGADYGVYINGANDFDKGPLRMYPSVSAAAPTHSADKGTEWLTSNCAKYVNTDGSTSWNLESNEIVGDSTPGRVLRLSLFEVNLYTSASNTAAFTIASSWQGWTATTGIPGIGKSGSSNGFTLDSNGVWFTYDHATINVVAVLSISMYDIDGGSGYEIEFDNTVDYLKFKFTDWSNNDIDVTAVAHTGKVIEFAVLYLTNS